MPITREEVKAALRQIDRELDGGSDFDTIFAYIESLERMQDAWLAAPTADAIHGQMEYEDAGGNRILEKWAEVHTDELPASYAGKRVRILPE